MSNKSFHHALRADRLRPRVNCILFGSIVLLGLLLTEPASQRAEAQVLFGSIVGNVTDSSGGAVPDASVRVTQRETNESHEVKTNESGGFVLSTLPAGTYSITISKAGFSKFVTTNMQLSLNTVVRADAVLQLGAQSESITVTTDAVALQTDRADVHAEFTNKQIVDIPQPTRTYQGMLAMMPGVAPPGASGGGTNNPGKSMQITANGTSRSGTEVRIDGVTDTNPWVQYYSTYVPSNEAIQTVNVVTASPDAEQGLTNGAAISVQTKSGANAVHGSLFEYHVNGALKARPFFLAANQGIPKLIENDLGGSLGGHIIKDKLFYFGSYEGAFISQAGSNTASLPLPAMLTGDLSGSPIPIYDPKTGNPDGTGRTQFPGNMIPAERVSPVTRKLLPLLPQPNYGVPGATSTNYYITTPITNRLHKMDTKADWNASSKLRISGRFGYSPYHVVQTTVLGPILAGGNAALQQGNAIATSVTATYTASPTFVIDANWGFTRANMLSNPPSVDKKLGADFLGIPGTNLGDLPLAGGMPNFTGIGFTNLGYSYPHLQYIDPIFQYTANASWNKGSHNIRFGFDISQQHMNHQEVQPTSFGFNGGATSLNGGPGTNGIYNNFADFLLGLPQSEQNSQQTTPWVTLRTWQYSLYIRDQWQVSHKLTVSYGTRWEYFPVSTRGDRGIEMFNLETAKITVCGVAGNPSDCGISVSKRLFAPRIGFAYRPTEKFVVRSGFSLSPEQISMYRDGLYSFPARLDFAGNGLTTYNPVGTLTAGIPTPPPVNISSGTLPIPAGLNFGFQGAILPQKFVRGYTESWNFSVQRDLGHGWTAQVGYVGTHTVHQHTRYNLNYGQVGGGSVSQPLFRLGITGNMNEILPYEAMHYNSLQASAQRRFGNGLSFQAAYTRSKWMGLCCDDSGDGGPAIPIPQYSFLNRSRMGGDRPDNLRMTGIYELPFGKGKPLFSRGGAASALAGGWQLNGAFSAYSGSPFTVSSSGTSLNAPGSAQRADQVKANVQMTGDIAGWFDPLAFAPVTTARFGTAGFNILRGPGVVNLDVSVFRAFKVSERLSVQFRAEALNATNTPHFSNPNANVSNMSLRPDGTINNLGGFTQITGTSAASRLTDERFLRFGLRIAF